MWPGWRNSRRAVEPGRRGLLAELKADPGQVGLETLLREIDKLAAVRALGLAGRTCLRTALRSWCGPGGLARAGRTRRTCGDDAAPVRLTLLAALCSARTAEITDALVDLLIGAGAEDQHPRGTRVEGELIEDLRRVRGKEGLLFRLAEAAVEHPDDTVRTASVPGRG